jgi:hypothetical protein
MKSAVFWDVVPDLLSCHKGHSTYHVKNSLDFVHVFGYLRVDTRDIKASLDLVSLFTRVPITETMIC